jgi:pyruvate-ferredoxin/flavodoxin oxidoreductase
MDREQSTRAIVEAEQHNGPSLILAYSPCIAHGYSLSLAKKQSEKASKSGYWPMYRFNPDLREQGLDPFSWDSPEIDTDFESYVEEEIRYRTLKRANPAEAERLMKLARKDNERRYRAFRDLADALKENNEEQPIKDKVHD